MSNLFKSKFLFGVMIVAVMFVGFAAVANTAAADCTLTTTLRVGSVGAEVSCVQSIVGATPDGKFGPMTKASVMAWQAGHSLTPDGVVGPLTRAALMGAPVGVSFAPAGCTSASGYSPTLGLAGGLCHVAGTPASGCLTPFDPMTGKACDGSTPSTSGPLAGGAGSITITGLSTYSNEDVGEGDSDAKVLAFEVEADDESDVDVSSVKVEFYQADSDVSQKLDDYVDSVSVWMGSTKVGSADADSFSENNDVYSKSISLDGAIVRAGDTEKFVIAVDVNGNLDSGDIADDNWSVGVANARFEDAEGVVTTESVTLDIEDGLADEEVEKFFFPADFASANDVELEADLTSSNPDEGVVIGDSSDNTEVEMLSFEFNAKGSDINVDSLEFDITSAGADTDEVATELVLKWGSDEQSESISDVNATTDAIVFNDLNIDIKEGDSMTFTVWANIKNVDGAPLVNGDSLQVSLDTSETDATDESGEDLTGVSELSGSADGETQHIFTEAVEVTYVSSSITPVDNGSAAAESATASLTLKVKALGGTVYLNGDDEATAADEGFGVIAVGADTLAAYEFVTSGDYTIFNSGADEEYYKITDGKTMTITINATITQGAAATVLGGIALDEVQFGTAITNSASRSVNVMNWSDLLDTLKSPKTTLVGV